ncbi:MULTISPECIES: fumarylacetoacetate hydrolase family protein [Streptosporangium]|uniref:5-carboxymethyl-2-hydroxymuconate isomerase n=1 Tax=Streptosporangium brasiliense TaxID=47480 RepID=A0ABT9R5E6_9ACTN|nr:fumarylacetoacetate hydrolase family protein [Streptosporangium brasiliense]MDP9864468.1 5-carboxymethyl-2-hydroxymuconate isomerase [Streptosporangium brasiliense]
MRLGTVRAGGARLAAVDREGLWYALDVPAGTPLETVLAGGIDETRRLAASAAGPIADAVPVAPLRPGKIVAIGLNYLDHIREAGMDRPERPLMFAKFPSSVIGPGEPIVIDGELTERVDWEVELAAVIGAPIRHASPAEALAGVAGYTVANDVSARDLQFADGQWTRGKSLDTFCPLGPAVVTPDELGDPQSLRLRTAVNGETVQDSSTAEMLFGVAELLSYCSRAFTLEPGDVVLTGTPWGCGEFMDPRRSLRPGDVVEVSVEGIGTLRDPVVGR